MLRLFVFREPSVITIRAEGGLSYGTIKELESLVTEHLAEGCRRVVLDFGDMTLEDDRAASFVEAAFESRARVLAISDQAETLLRKRAAVSCQSRCNRVQRFLFSEVRHLHALPERLRGLLCRSLRKVLPQRILDAAEFLCVDARARRG